MNNENTEATQQLTSSENQVPARKVCSRRNKKCDNEKEKEEVKRILTIDEFTSIRSPTKRAIHYEMVKYERNYPDVPKSDLFGILNVKPKRYYRKVKKVMNGFDYDLQTKCTIFNDEEGRELILFIQMNAERRTCLSKADVVMKATEIVSRRRVELNFGVQLDFDSVIDWCKSHGVHFGRSWDRYHVQAISDRESIEQMVANIHLMMKLWHYPPELIANMDETWVALQDKVYSGVVAYTDGCKPISIAPADGSHITLIGCITLSGEVVTPVTILPTSLKTASLIDHNKLWRLNYCVNPSGFMNGDIFAMWIDRILGPWFDRRRTNPFQHALLICDAHSSRMNERAKQALKRHRIDMIVLPAHVTSRHQPLDVGIYSAYKTYLNKMAKKVESGMYGRIRASVNAFTMATVDLNIDAAWKQSKLFDKDYKKVIQSYLPRLPNARVCKNANYIVPCETVTEV